MLEKARAEWPDIELDAGVFQRFVEERASEGELQVEDAYLACAALTGSPNAFARLDAYAIEPLRPMLTRLDRGAGRVDDALQAVRNKLLYGEPVPKLAQYTARGSLRGFVRVIAVRELIAMSRGGPQAISLEESPIAEVVEAADTELAAMRARYGAEFKLAFEQAMEKLEPRQRNLLRHQLLDGLGVDQIGGIYGIHRATAARWLVRAREDLLDGTCRILSERLGLETGDFESVIRVIGSQLDASVSRILSSGEQG